MFATRASGEPAFAECIPIARRLARRLQFGCDWFGSSVSRCRQPLFRGRHSGVCLLHCRGLHLGTEEPLVLCPRDGCGKHCPCRIPAMLVLSRRAQESICIGPDIVVTVAEIRPRSVRLAISAPATTSVHRLEVHSRIDEAVRAAEAQIGKVGSPGPAPGHSLPALDPPREV